MKLDNVVQDHSPENLQSLFSAKLITQYPQFSVLLKETHIPWLLFIPTNTLNDATTRNSVYHCAHTLAEHLEFSGFSHYNLAKIGNKNPWLHLHLVFRSETDEAWPDAIWCHEPLRVETQSTAEKIQQIQGVLQQHFAAQPLLQA